MAPAARSRSTVNNKKENTVSPTKKAVAKKAAPARRKKVVEPKSNHPLAHLIPPKWMAEEYISREIDGIRDIDWLDYARKSMHNVLMYGPTGPGKTSCVYAYAAEKQIPVVYVACNGAIDPATMFVRVLMDPDGRFQYVEMDSVRACRFGPCIWLLDEINALPPRNAMVLHGALDKRRQMMVMELDEVINLHDESQIIGTYNPDYEGTKPLNEAFNNRFSIQLEFAYDPEIEKKLVTGIPVLLDLATRLRGAQENQDIDTPVGPNLLLEFEQIAWELSIDAALGNFIRRFKAHERSVVQNAVTHFETQIRQQFKIAKEAESKR